MKNPTNWKKYGFEFLSIFVAVIAAFALNNWNESRKSSIAQEKILYEINNGIDKDLKDIAENMSGHKRGLEAVKYWRKAIVGNTVSSDSLRMFFFALTRDYIAIQNTSGYETLKSRGLELVSNDSLRFEILNLYEFDYKVLHNLEQDYHEMQFNQSHSENLMRILSANFTFDENGAMKSIELPLRINKKDKKYILIVLEKVKYNRAFLYQLYQMVKENALSLQKSINEELRD
jgi:hypothetical protein